MEMMDRAAEAYLEGAAAPTAAAIGFLKGVWALQAEAEAVDREYEPPSSETAGDALVSGQPLFLAAPPPVPREEYLDLLGRVVEYTASESGLAGEQADALRDADFRSALGEDSFASAGSNPSGFVSGAVEAVVPEEGALKAPTVAFVLVSALVPFLTGPAAKALAALDEKTLSGWDSGSCPVCGSAAALGRMGEGTTKQGAQRTLWCGMCHAEWSYDRIRCVRCGDRKPEGLRYRHEESDPAHRVHLCEACKGYLKVVFTDDLRKPLSMPVEDAVTGALDAIARAEGYSPTPSS